MVQPTEGSRFRWWHVAAVIGFCATIFFTQLGAAGLWDRDEPRNAGCAAEMLQANNWIVPVFNDQLRRQKPVLTYWMMMSSYQVFGINEFAARFWSAVLSVVTCLITWRIGWRLFGYWQGMLAAVILPGTMMFTVAARAATPDSYLILFFTLAVLVFVESNAFRWQGEPDGDSGANGKAGPNVTDPGSDWRLGLFPAVLLYVSIGLGALAKGLAGVVPPLAAIGLFLMIVRLENREPVLRPTGRTKAFLLRFMRVASPVNFFRALMLMRPVVGLAIVLIVAGPWYTLVGIATEGEFLRLFFLYEHLGRATEVFEGHSGGPWFYPVSLFLGFLPWSIFAVPVIGETLSMKSGPNWRSAALPVCWIVVVVGLFSLATTKLPSYVTPCYPALALLTANSMVSFAMGTARLGDRWYQTGFYSYGLFAILVTAGMAVAGFRYLGGHWETGLAGLPLLAGAGYLMWCRLCNTPQRRRIPAGIAIASGLFSLVLFGPAAQIVDSTRQTKEIFSVMRSAAPDVPIGSFRCLESTWVVYGQHPIYELTRSKTNDGQMDKPRKFWERLPWISPRELADRHPRVDPDNGGAFGRTSGSAGSPGNCYCRSGLFFA